MIRPNIILAIARAEMRLTRRLVRFWVFQTLAFLIGLLFLAYYTWIHVAVSAQSATAAAINPRFFLGFVGIYYIVVFLLGLLFLGFDVRARDRRERMSEVLDALPCSNVELLLGKYLGILITSWIPLLFWCGVVIVGSGIAGSPVQLHSVVTFSVVMALPAYTFMIGFVFLMTLLVRHRGIAALLGLAVLVGLVMINFVVTPIYLLPLGDLTGGFTVPGPSDMMPKIADGYSAIQRLAVTLFGFGFIWLAAAVHPRRDDAPRAVRAAIGGGMLAVATALLLGLVSQGTGALERREQWREAHAARSDEAIPDLRSMIGTVSIDPGSGIRMQLELTLGSERTLATALFSLNPGLEVTSATSRSGGTLETSQQDGLLEVVLGRRLAPGDSETIVLEIEGRLHPDFSYLDAAFDPLANSVKDGNIFLLGYEPFIFSSDVVVLMPGASWLPLPGPEVGRGDVRQRPPDFFDVELTVDVPGDWRVAGPGRARAAGADGGDRATYAFAPGAPVPDVALIAAPYESRSAEVDGVTLELLLHPKHAAAFDVLQPAVDEVRNWLAQRLEEAAAVGLAYPYDGLTLVETPGSLRGYGGGWRMGSTFVQPGLILMRESGFPTARFDFAFRNPDSFKDTEGGMPRAMLNGLEQFFETDFAGGNPFVAAARSFFGFQTSGVGAEALSLNFVNDDLTARLVAGKRGYFSVHHYGADINDVTNRAITAIFARDGRNMADVVIDAVTSRGDVWDSVMQTSLDQLDPWEDPRLALDVLTLKGGAMAESMIDGLGREKAGRLLSELRSRFSGEAFSREQFLEAGAAIDEDLEPWLDVWLTGTDLPGFTLGPVELVRLTDDDLGSPRYQLRVVLRNGEGVPGLARLEYGVGERQRGKAPEMTEPISVPARSSVVIGLVTSEPPRRATIAPYLSLNRDAFAVTLPELDEEDEPVDEDPFSGVQASDWLPPDSGQILIDDLDEGFTVVESESRGFFRFGGGGEPDETDNGLPVVLPFQGPPSRWSRSVRGDAWGRYRHTAAIVRPGKGESRAIFAAELPEAGNWLLECHIPRRYLAGAGGRSRLGGWKLALVHSGGTESIEFDAAKGESGWNQLGRFDLAVGEVRVELTDDSDGRIVVADAIRWTPDRRRAANTRTEP